MPTRSILRRPALRRLVPLAASMIVVLVAGAGPARAAAPVQNGKPMHTIASEIRPDGTQGPSFQVPAVQAPPAGGAGFGRLCAGHPEEYGNWNNADPNANGIARIELRDCQPVTQCSGDICSITYDAGWIMHVFGKCSPTNCDWGWSAGQFRLSSGQVYGFYDQGFAKRYVYAKMSQYRAGQLWVYWRTDFTDPNRADYEMQEWFVRA